MLYVVLSPPLVCARSACLVIANSRSPRATVHLGSLGSGGAQLENDGPTTVLTRWSPGAIAAVTVIEYEIVADAPAGIGPDQARFGAVNVATPTLATASLLNVAEASTSDRSSVNDAGDPSV